MPRKRQIDPDIWKSEQVVDLPIEARLLFIGMISQADDEGRLKGSAFALKMSIFPADSYKLEMVKRWRNAIINNHLVALYQFNGTEYLWIPNFKKHQYMTKSFPSKLPEPPIEVINQVLTDYQQVNKSDIPITNTITNTNREGDCKGEREKTKKPAKPKKRYGEFNNVLLTDSEYGKLLKRFGEDRAKHWIKSLSEGIESKGYKYHSHYATILRWVEREEKRQGGNNGAGKPNSRELPTHYTRPEDYRIDIGPEEQEEEVDD